MRTAVNSNFHSTVKGVDKEPMWNFGVEIWCNKPGRYTTIVADMSHISVSRRINLSHLGIMGTRY